MEYDNAAEKIIINFHDDINQEPLQVIKDTLIKVLSFKKPIAFNGKNLTKVEIPILQLLISFTLSASKENIQWYWIETSDYLNHIAKLLGMSELLKITEG